MNSLKMITPKSFPQYHGKPRVRFSKSGSIFLNRAAASLMGLKKGDKVVFLADEENPEDLFVMAHEDGFTLGGLSNGELAIYNRQLKAEFDSRFGGGSYAFELVRRPIHQDDQKMWLLITAERRRFLKEQEYRLIRKEVQLGLKESFDCPI